LELRCFFQGVKLPKKEKRSHSEQRTTKKQKKDADMQKIVSMLMILALLLPTSTFANTTYEKSNDYKQIYCIAYAMYFEGRGEGDRGMAAIGHSIVNRSHNPKYPKTPCGVIYEPGQFTYQHHAKIDDQKSFDQAVKLSKPIYDNQDPDLTHGALSFHAKYVHPSWIKHMIKTASIGHHIFYKFA